MFRDCQPGGKLHPALVDEKINLDHPVTAQYGETYGYTGTDKLGTWKATASKSKNEAWEVSVDDDDETPASEIMAMPLIEIVKRYGKNTQFKDYVLAYHKLTQIQGLEEEQARKRGEFIHRVHAERLTALIDALGKSLLADVVTNIANSAMSMAIAGASRQEIERAVRAPIERTIKTVKDQAVRGLRDA